MIKEGLEVARVLAEIGKLRLNSSDKEINLYEKVSQKGWGSTVRNSSRAFRLEFQ